MNLAKDSADSGGRARLYLVCGLLAIGQFALVTSVWMLTGLLKPLSAEFDVSLGTAGQVLSVFSISYAISTPLLAVATAQVKRRTLLVSVLLLFVGANLLAAFASNFGMLLASRAVAGAADGLYGATATAAAVALAPPEWRGRVLALLNTGVTLALFAGVPLSTMIGHEFGWRGTFLAVAGIAGVAGLGLIFLLPHVATPPVASLKERLSVIRIPGVIPTLAIAGLSYIGLFTVYAYLAPILSERAGVGAADMSKMLLAFGFATVIGNWLGGQAADRWGCRKALGFSLIMLVPLLVALPILSQTPASAAVMLFLWGGFHYFGLSPLQLQLATIAPNHAGVALALNSSVIYLGVAAGAALGGVMVDNFPLLLFGFAGAAFKLAALLVLIRWIRSSPTKAEASA
ncbi:MAG: transporter, family, inner rane transport protein [Sphingomonadales bacterium]|jgi:predicted MFS family arabinose efflux permease|nr:transporter, family, inner rane transport protein [Sphingomonadales bacterium]